MPKIVNDVCLVTACIISTFDGLDVQMLQHASVMLRLLGTMLQHVGLHYAHVCSPATLSNSPHLPATQCFLCPVPHTELHQVRTATVLLNKQIAMLSPSVVVCRVA